MADEPKSAQEEQPDSVENAKAQDVGVAGATAAASAAATPQTSGTTEVQNAKFLHVKIHSPSNTYFDGEAESVSAVNDTGPFDILLGHHRFLTLLNAGDIVVKTANGEEKIPITNGVMHVKTNEVIVFLDI